MIAAFIRLGKKYGIILLRSEAMDRLEHHLPSTLNNYDKCQGSSLKFIERKKGFFSKIADLAREQALPCLPFALYSCCERFQCVVVEMRRGQLTQQNRETCIRAIHKLYTLQTLTTFDWLLRDENNIYNSCKTPKACPLARKILKCDIWPSDPELMGLKSWDDRWNNGMCQRCIEAAMSSHAKGRVKFWEKMPEFFGLPDWNELIKE